MAEAPSPDPALLTGLRKAKVGPLPLQEKGAVGGMFPKGKAGEPLAKHAQQEGLVEEVKEKREVTTTSRGKSKTTTKDVVIGWGLTPAGLQYLADADSPKAALEALLPYVQKLAGPTAQPTTDFTAFAGTVDKATRECVSAIEKAFAGLRADVLRAVAPSNGAALDPAPILAALTTALSRIESPTIKPPVVAKQPDPTPKPAPDSAGAVTDEIVSFVATWTREKTVGPPLDAIMKHLRVSHPQLTVGAFHDALRRLVGANPPSIKLSGWSKTIHELPDPELALFVKHTVMYYAHSPQ